MGESHHLCPGFVANCEHSWWGPKVLLWIILVVVSFFIPNGFFIFWGNYVSLIGATIFILLGLILLVDFAHSWSETCLENWEKSDSNLWQWILITSTAAMYAGTIALTGVLYGFFAGSGCTLNRFFISFNLALCIIITILCVHPVVQEHNPRSGLAQSGMVAAYCTYLIVSAVSNHEHAACNPLRKNGTRTTTVVLGAIFTFLAIAYSTSRAATQSRALAGKSKKGGAIQLPVDGSGHAELEVVSTQPSRMESPRYQALLAAVEAGYVSCPVVSFCQRLMKLLAVLFLLLPWMKRRKMTTTRRLERDGMMNDPELDTTYGPSLICTDQGCLTVC
jgi:serine incorporator 1/3